MAERNGTPQPDRDADTLTEKPGKGKSVLVLVLSLAVACAGGIGVGFTQYGQIARTTAAFQSEPGPDSEAPPKYGQFTRLDGLIVNPSGTEGRRYLMVSIGLESDKAGVLTELDEKEVVVRDLVLKVLSAHTVQELSAIEQRSTLKEELRTAVNAILNKGEVQRLYFTQFVLQ